MFFFVNYLYSNELIGYVDFSDFNKTSLDISAWKCEAFVEIEISFLWRPIE